MQSDAPGLRLVRPVSSRYAAKISRFSRWVCSPDSCPNHRRGDRDHPARAHSIGHGRRVTDGQRRCHRGALHAAGEGYRRGPPAGRLRRRATLSGLFPQRHRCAFPERKVALTFATFGSVSHPGGAPGGGRELDLPSGDRSHRCPENVTDDLGGQPGTRLGHGGSRTKYQQSCLVGALDHCARKAAKISSIGPASSRRSRNSGVCRAGHRAAGASGRALGLQAGAVSGARIARRASRPSDHRRRRAATSRSAWAAGRRGADCACEGARPLPGRPSTS
jgi:hypothetical protein